MQSTKYINIMKFIVISQSDMFDNMSSIILTPIHRIFVHFSLFWQRVSFFLFSLIKSITIISYILIFYTNFELIFEFMALKRAPICGRNVCLSFFLRKFKSNSDNFNQRK